MSGPPPSNTLPAICKPVIIETDGVFGELETGAIINAGGTSSSTFTVGGVPVLLQGGGVGQACTGYEFVQNTPILTWNINHGGNTFRVTATIYGTDNKQVWPDGVEIVDANNVSVTFAAPQAGVALLILF